MAIEPESIVWFDNSPSAALVAAAVDMDKRTHGERIRAMKTHTCGICGARLRNPVDPICAGCAEDVLRDASDEAEGDDIDN